MRFGVDYYPEHWPEERWAEDARLMQGAGVNVVRMAEFSWARLEPEQGRFDFPWLDRAISVLAERGIATVLGTPTAAPPRWLVASRPEILPVTASGVRLGFGARRHYCPNVEAYREATARIVAAMARHYADNPSVIGWQIDNEFGEIDGAGCHCPACAKAFQEWLRQRYESIDDLNRAWGTEFWSQRYGDFDEVVTPAACPGVHNPGLLLDYRRFRSDSFVGYQRLQAGILRRLCPGRFMTHNMMGLYPCLDYFDLARDLDLVSWDNYPRLSYRMEVDWTAVGLAHDLMRGIKDRAFWVMEAQAGPGGWGENLFPSPLPGELRLWAYQAVAHGADAVVFFRWRTCQFGQEEFWHGLLDYGGLPTRRYEEAARLGRELAAIGRMIEGTRPRAQAALLLSYENIWAWQIQPHSPALGRALPWLEYAAALARRHVPIDVVGPCCPTERLAAYRLLAAPGLMLADQGLVASLEAYVRGGGTLLLTFRSGLKDVHGRMLGRDGRPGPTGRLAVGMAPAGGMPPGPFARLAGLTVDDYSALCDAETAAVAGCGDLGGWAGVARLWAEALHPDQTRADGRTEVIATYASGRYRGMPAVCVAALGRGSVIYVGAAMDERDLAGIVDYACLKAGVAGLPIKVDVEARTSGPDPGRDEDGVEEGSGVEACVREGPGGRFLFVLNHSGEPREVRLEEGDYRDLLSGERVTRGASLTVGPRDVRVLAEA